MFAVGKFPLIHNFRRFDCGGVYVGVKSSTSRFKILLTAKILGDVLDWIKKSPPKSKFKQLFLETRTLLIPIMSGNAKSPAEGLKDECERGVVTTRPPIPYVASVDPYKKQEKAEIKTKLPDGTSYQMVPFRTGSNKDYVNHIIAMIRLIKQKDMSKDPQEKESLKKPIDATKKDLEKVEKKTLTKIVKAYELFCTYFIDKARTQWDKVVQELHQKDP